VVHIEHEYGVFGLDGRFHQLLAEIQCLRLPAVLTLHTVHTALSFDLGCGWGKNRLSLDEIDIERYQRDVGAAADVVVVHQEAPMRKVLIRQGVSGQRVVTIPHGTSLATSITLGTSRPSGSPLLVAFGYFEPTKNHHVLIEAFAELRATWPTAQLLVGAHIRHPVPQTVAYLERCERLVSELDLSANVAFLKEPVAEHDVETLLAAADVACFVYDEDTRSSSGALHRAVGCGVPVVAARVAKFTEVSEISDELLVNPRSAGELAQLLKRMLSDGEFCSLMRQRGHAFAKATSWNRVAARHLAIYQRLAQLRGSDRRWVPRQAASVP
jgi:glycosyltransferase involved in cell wall biosynthesis